MALETLSLLTLETVMTLLVRVRGILMCLRFTKFSIRSIWLPWCPFLWLIMAIVAPAPITLCRTWLTLTMLMQPPQLSRSTCTRNGFLRLMVGGVMRCMTDLNSGLTPFLCMLVLRLVQLPRVEVQIIGKLSRLLSVFSWLKRLKARPSI